MAKEEIEAIEFADMSSPTTTVTTAAAAPADEEQPLSYFRSMTNSSSSSTNALLFWRSKTDESSRDFGLQERSTDGNGGGEGDAEQSPSIEAGSTSEYRTYKRRWFGLVQLTLMNIVVSWGWLTYAPVADFAAEYYDVDASAINWLSVAFFFAFVVIFPLCIVILHRGLKPAFICGAVLLLVGNWIRYAGSTNREGGTYACAMVGGILIGFAQPFVLAAPTRYSDIWFTDRGRVAATALASLANPFGAALGQLINPLWASEADDVSRIVLYVAIITSVCCIPAFFIPSQPPTPVGPSSETPKMDLIPSIRSAIRSPELWLIFATFSVFVGLFNAISTLLNQMLVPYGFSNDQAGIGGAVLIVAGLVFAAITSPIIDRTKKFLLAVKVFTPLIALCYFIFIWMPETRNVAGPYVVLAVLGSASFALVPIALEFLADLSHPISPELTSTTAWAGGQLFGAIFVIIGDALVAGPEANPPRHMKNFLIFQGVLGVVATPMVIVLGWFGRRDKVVLRRLQQPQQEPNAEEADERTAAYNAGHA